MIKYAFNLFLIIFPYTLIYAQDFSSPSSDALEKMSFTQFLESVAKYHPAKKEDDLEISKAQLFLGQTGKLSDPMLSLSRNNVPLINVSSRI